MTTAIVVSVLVIPIVARIINEVSTLIIEEFHSLYDLKENCEELCSSLSAIQAVLKDAQKKQLNDAGVRDWLGKLQKAALDVEDALEIYKTDVSLFKLKKLQKKTPFSGLFDTGICYKHNAATNFKKLSKTLVMIGNEKGSYNFVSSAGATNPDLPPRTSSILRSDDVVGRIQDKDKIIEMLLSEHDANVHPRVIPITGMGGLGKTTLAQLVYNDKRINYLTRIWVCVSANFDMTRIVKEMIESLTKMSYDINLSKDLLENQFLQAVEKEKLLLVLDDVWMDDYDKWMELKELLKRGNVGSSVLVTCRSLTVANLMGTKPTHHLSDLPEEECWSLFKNVAFDSTTESSGVQTALEDIGRKIVRKCHGLPLAVNAIGGILRGKYDAKMWTKISNNEIWKVEEEQDYKGYNPKILPALKLSYDYLSPHLKACFAYCSIFPKAHVFDKEELVKLWMAEALIKWTETARSEETGDAYFDELFFKSFFQHSNVSSQRYMMHDLMHDLAESISSSYCYQVKDNESCGTTENTRHLSILSAGVDGISTQIIKKSKKLRTLLLPNQYMKDLGKTTIENLFHALRYMRVLDLSSCLITELPETIEELKLLSYLNLSKTRIRMLPDSICNLINLQTLKLLRCLWLVALPMNLGNLTKLRYLELDDIFWYKCSTLPPRLGRLTNLHNLNTFSVGIEEGYGIDELNKMVYLTGVLHISGLENVEGDAKDAKLGEKESLDKVVLEWSDTSSDVALTQDHQAAQEKVLEELQPHSNITELHIRHYKGSSIPLWIRDGQLRKLSKISLIHCTKCRILSLGQLPKISELCIKGMLELEEWQELVWDQFRSLDILKISDCPKLKKLPRVFSNLEVMKIKRCCSLKTLAATPLLESLILVDNPVLEEWHDTAYQYMFRRFTDLTVVNCNKLRALPKPVFTLQTLEIRGCELWSTLPIQASAQILQRLAIGSCRDDTLLRAIPSSNSLYSLVISGISSLIVLSKWPHLPGLKFLYISHCEDLLSLSQDEEEQSMRSLTALTLLSIRNCPKFEKFPSQGLPAKLECLIISACPNIKLLGTNGGMLKGLTSLKDLYVEDCPTLLSLPEDGIPPSLRHLYIKGCPLLSDRCKKEGGGGPDWPKIMNVPDLEIDSTIATSLSENVIQASNPGASSVACFPNLNICGRGKFSKGKMTQGESSTQASKSKFSKGKMTRGESSTQASQSKFSKGKMTQGNLRPKHHKVNSQREK